ncbi:MAG: anti-CBASS Acb1 family protein [Pseudomonadota bacterium]
MSNLTVQGSVLENALQNFLMADSTEPGTEASYQACKTIYEWHPLGLKMAQKPLRIAMSQEREIVVTAAPGDAVVQAFIAEWQKIGADEHIINVGTLARVYGIASCAFGAPGIPTNDEISPEEYYKLKLYFNDLDPLNTSGSLVLNQDPNSPDFQKHAAIAVSGQPYARSRSVTIMNERPIYISYTSSAFGFVGRSVYQRALFPLKSFVQTMVTDDMVTRKAGVLVAKIKQTGAVVNNLIAGAMGIKRNIIKESQTTNVINIGIEDSVEVLDMQNAEKANYARKNILENIAAADDMPARMLTEETLAEGFGEGSEDAKKEAQYIDRMRKWLQPLYGFFDPIVMYRAWNPDFYQVIQAQYPEIYGNVDYKVAFTSWMNSFRAEWPNLLKEPDSELAKGEKVKLDGIIQMLQTLLPALDPENKARLIQWACDNCNDMKLLFGSSLEFDMDALMEFVPPEAEDAGDDSKDKKASK